MSTVQQRFKEFDDKLDEDLKGFALLEQVAAATRQRKSHVALAFSAVIFVMVFLGIGAGFLCNLVGFVYPAYASFKAIESHATEDDTQWLTYWVVYAVFAICETFVSYILYWVPFFYVLKLGFLVWAMHPTTLGAVVVYKTVISQFLKEHEERIDSTLNSGARASKRVASGVATAAAGVARDNVGAIVKGVMSASEAAAAAEGKKED